MVVQSQNFITRDCFLEGGRRSRNGFKYVSLFSGGGIGDIGFTRAGWECVAACEADEDRRGVLLANIPNVKCFGDIRIEIDDITDYVHDFGDIDLVIATPPCQSFSTANSRRGKMADPEKAAEDSRNSLFFYAITAINKIKPKVAVFENVPNFFERQLYDPRTGVLGKVGGFLGAYLSEYIGYHDVACLSVHGLHQRRKRASAIYVRQDVAKSAVAIMRGEEPLIPKAWAREAGSVPQPVGEALIRFRHLDAQSEEQSTDPHDPLHSVPHYDPLRYRWVSEIPAGSGRSAYENVVCPECRADHVPLGLAACHICSSPMINRPHVRTSDRIIRLVKGFKTSYRRMPPDDLAPTVTTASSHFGSDIKLHPWQNRVLSARECAHLQTIPNDFDWTTLLSRKRPKGYAIRKIIGEAVPSWFSFQLACKVEEYLQK